MAISRSVLVTGGSKGIGLATARLLAEQGHRVTVTHHSSPAPEGLAAVECDTSSREEIDAALTKVRDAQGPVEVLVTAAAITRDTLAIVMSEEKWDQVLATNLTGPVYAAQRAARDMVQGNWGRIIMLGSVGATMGTAGQLNYAAAKLALLGASRVLARELGPKGVTCNVVSPGLTDTDMIKKMKPAYLEQLISMIPIKRLTLPEEVAAVIAFLVGDIAAAVNGVEIAVDGGAAMGR